MSGTTKTHWKKYFHYDYLGTQDVPQGTEPIFKILSIKQEEVTGPNGKKETCPVVRFDNVPKGLILNRTNAKAISKVAKSVFTEDWIGVSVQLYIQDNISAFGTTTDGLRVRDFAPKIQNTEQKNISILAKKLIDQLAKYKGDDADDIRLMLKDKKKSGEITEKLLLNTLEKINSEKAA